MVYGISMALVETYLFVYLERAFMPAASKSLLGVTIAIMCIFEVPIFFYFDRLLIVMTEINILTLCHAVHIRAWLSGFWFALTFSNNYSASSMLAISVHGV